MLAWEESGTIPTYPAQPADRNPMFLDKLYTPRLSKGYCGLYHPSTNESIVFKFDVESVPYIGLWICRGGVGPAPKSHTHLQWSLAMDSLTHCGKPLVGEKAAHPSLTNSAMGPPRGIA